MISETVAPDFFPLTNLTTSDDTGSPAFWDDATALGGLLEFTGTNQFCGTNLNLFDPLVSSDLPYLEEEAEARKKRLAHKAHLARESRKRKKTREEELQNQVAELQRELERERKRTTGLETPCNFLPRRPNSFIMNENHEAALCSFVESVVENAQQDSARLNQLQTSMLPSLPLRFLQWILSQNEKFYSDPGSLWFSLFVQEVEASPAQLDQLLNLRRDYLARQPVSFRPGDSLQAFDLLRHSLDESTRLFGCFLQMFAPEQHVRFFRWVERFGAVCIKVNNM